MVHRNFATTAVALGLSSGLAVVTASAADFGAPSATIYTKAPVAVPYSWTGFYAGVQAGYGWSGDNVNTVGSPISFNGVGRGVGGAIATMNASAAAAAMDFNTSPKGFLGGGTLGYNLQNGQFVWGVETDLSWADIKGTATVAGTAPLVGFPPNVINSSGTAEQKMDAFGTFRARLGFLPTNKLLIFSTGGLAYGHVESNTNIAENLAPIAGTTTFSDAIGSASSWRAGWTAGAGLEYAFAPHWTAKAEYLYYDLASISYNSTITGQDLTAVRGGGFFPVSVSSVGVSSNADFKGNIVRGGINYHF